MFKLPSGAVVSGSEWVDIDGMQYLLNRMTSSELTEIGVQRVEPVAQTVDQNFYLVSQDGGAPVAKPIESIRQMLKDKVAADRWQSELQGITLANGKVVPADDTSLIRMLLAYVVARSNPAFTIQNFKLADGSYVNLTNAQIINVFENIANKILTTLYTKNKQIDAQIDALNTVEEAQAFTWSWS